MGTHTAGGRLQKFTTPKGVEAAMSGKDPKDRAALLGALASVEKGGRAVGSDEGAMQQAGHYWRVLSGREKQKLGKKDWEKIAQLVGGFVQGPKI